jgi:site-specific DNA-adenine methylase
VVDISFSFGITNGCGLIYLNPPYIGKNRANKGEIYKEANYYWHKGFPHEKAGEMVRRYNEKGGGKIKIGVSYNRCQLVKEMFKGFYKYNAVTDYSIKQKVRRAGIVEWLITNFEIDSEVLEKFKNIEYDKEEEI